MINARNMSKMNTFAFRRLTHKKSSSTNKLELILNQGFRRYQRFSPSHLSSNVTSLLEGKFHPSTLYCSILQENQETIFGTQAFLGPSVLALVPFGTHVFLRGLLPSFFNAQSKIRCPSLLQKWHV